MKRLLATLVGSAFIAMAGTAATRAEDAQQPLRELPPLLRAVSDEPGALSLAQGQALSRQVSDIERRTGVTIVVVILTTTRPESIEVYVQRLINRWLRESKRLDRGRFVFVAVAKDDRELRIVPSEKLAWVLKAIGDSEMTVKVPALLKQDKYFEALSAIAKKLSQLLADPGRMVLERIELWRSEVFLGINLALQKPVAGCLIAYAMTQAQRDGSG